MVLVRMVIIAFVSDCTSSLENARLFAFGNARNRSAVSFYGSATAFHVMQFMAISMTELWQRHGRLYPVALAVATRGLPLQSP